MTENKRYRLLKDLPYLKYGAEYISGRQADCGDNCSYVPNITGMKHNRFAIHIDWIKDNPTWFEELVTEPSIVPERISVEKIKYTGRNYMAQDLGKSFLQTHEFITSELISEDKFPAIKQAIENAINDTTQPSTAYEYLVEENKRLIDVISIGEDYQKELQDEIKKLKGINKNTAVEESKMDGEYWHKMYQELRSTLPIQQVQEDKPFIWDDATVKEMIYSKLPIPEHYCGNLQKCLDEFIQSKQSPTNLQENVDTLEQSKPLLITEDGFRVYNSSTKIFVVGSDFKQWETNGASCTNNPQNKYFSKKQFADIYVTENKPQSPTVNPEWEIQCIVSKDKNYWIQKDGLFKSDLFGEHLPAQWFLANGGTIHSVKRLSDNTVWVFDETFSNNTAGIYSEEKIKSFEIWGDKMKVRTGEGEDVSYYLLEAISKLPIPNTDTISIKPVLFTTDDGQPVFDGTKYYAVFEFEIIICQADVAGKKFTAEWLKMCKDTKTFLIKEAAEQYILENKPCLSLAECKEVMGSYKLWNPIQKLIYKAKFKINKQ